MITTIIQCYEIACQIRDAHNCAVLLLYAFLIAFATQFMTMAYAITNQALFRYICNYEYL